MRSGAGVQVIGYYEATEAHGTAAHQCPGGVHRGSSNSHRVREGHSLKQNVGLFVFLTKAKELIIQMKIFPCDVTLFCHTAKLSWTLDMIQFFCFVFGPVLAFY